MKEVIKKIEEMGFEVDVNNVSTSVLRNNKVVAWVVTYQPHSIDTTYNGFYELDYTTKEKLFILLLQLYQEPKYHWKLKGVGELSRGEYLRYYGTIDEYGLDNLIEIDGTRTQFTKREFEEIKKELGFTLEFEPEEVE